MISGFFFFFFLERVVVYMLIHFLSLLLLWDKNDLCVFMVRCWSLSMGGSYYFPWIVVVTCSCFDSLSFSCGFSDGTLTSRSSSVVGEGGSVTQVIHKLSLEKKNKNNNTNEEEVVVVQSRSKAHILLLYICLRDLNSIF